MNLPKLDVSPYLDIAFRRKWWIIISFLLTFCAGVVYAIITPKVYEATTLILVQAQRVPTSYVQPTVTESVESRLATISQQLHSRTNLERVIKQFNLYPQEGASAPKTPMQRLRTKVLKKLADLGVVDEELLAEEEERDKPRSMYEMASDLAKKISVRTLGDRSSTNAFEISFEWHDPEVVASVANAIASQFIEENLKVREEMAIGTTDFLERESEKMRHELERWENSIEEFKREHMGSLPDQLQSNLNILNQLQDEMNALEQRLDAENMQLRLLTSQHQSFKEYGNEGRVAVSTGGGQENSAPNIPQMEAQLQAMKMRYTERHPDVLMLQKQIEALKALNDTKSGSGSGTRYVRNPAYAMREAELREQMALAYSRVKSIEKQTENLQKDIAVYKQRIEATPAVELKLTKLTRDYEAIRERYNIMLAKKLDARMAEELEKRQKGEQFKIQDPAMRPSRPLRPDIFKIIVMAMAMGFGLGAGLAYVVELLDPSFHSPEELAAYLKTEVIVSLPVFKMNKDAPKKGYSAPATRPVPNFPPPRPQGPESEEVTKQ